ncbi:hypothetical protein ACFL0S_04275 [Thermodesulfobacteriota bacterium]
MAMERLLVVGGKQRSKAIGLDEWQAYEKGVILEVKPESGNVEVVVEYESPTDVRPATLPAIVFKAGALNSDQSRILVCTQTELVEFDTKTWNQTFYFSHPFFNDVHHACYRKDFAAGERILVANTGLDQILEFRMNRESNLDSELVNQWSVSESDTWARFDRDVDYRLVATTKPHQCHPNFVWEVGERIIATRFHQQDAFDVVNKTVVCEKLPGNPHDGLRHGSLVYFTTTNGCVVSYDWQSGKRIESIELSEIQQATELLGWCRGIELSSELIAWVGFSRIRPTWLRKNLSWIKQGFRRKGEYGTLPTRIAQYDLKSRQLLHEFDLEPYGLNAVFGIYSVSQERR